jgi:hypothetical protein
MKYRILQVGEPIVKGDVFREKDKPNQKLRLCDVTIGGNVWASSCLKYYRPIKGQPKKDPLLKVGDKVKIDVKTSPTCWNGQTGTIKEYLSPKKKHEHPYGVSLDNPVSLKNGGLTWFSVEELIPVPKYRYLRDGEIVRKGDLVYFPETRGWGKAKMTVGMTVNKANESAALCGATARRFRRKVG